MKGIRTSSLFHYTDYDILKKIIRTGLFPNYCAEDISFEQNNKQRGELIGVPMVSFCDIPLSRIDEFADRYSFCAIGLHKSWADNKAINPVFYAKDPSTLEAFNTMTFIARQLQYKARTLDDTISFSPDFSNAEQVGFFYLSKALRENTLPLFGYVKKYEGERQITGEDGKQSTIIQNNYIENEWRYIIPESNTVKWLWGEQEYNSWRGDKTKPKPSPSKEIKDHTLTFNVDDISFIIVETEEQVKEMIPWLSYVKNVGGHPVCPKEVTDLKERGRIIENVHRKLISKVISLERIRLDF